MSANVFANGREIAGKASSNQSIAAMPDVCLSPPPPPAGPVPIPYPNMSMASDMTGGSKTVLVGGKEAGLKNASSYKKSNGNEPATNSFGANIVTHVIQGATRFAAWSFDVLIEGQNAVRLLDLTTHNHANAGGGGVTASTGEPFVITEKPETCEELQAKNEASRNAMKESERVTVKRLVEQGSRQIPNAIAHASVTLGSKIGTAFGASHRSILDPKANNSLKGQSQSGPSKNVCPNNPFPYTKFRHHFHAEAKILENAPQNATVLFAIDWRSPRAKSGPTEPCEYCRALMLHACEAGCLIIKICGPDAKSAPENVCEGASDATGT